MFMKTLKDSNQNLSQEESTNTLKGVNGTSLTLGLQRSVRPQKSMMKVKSLRPRRVVSATKLTIKK